MATESGELDPERAHGILQNRRRRRVIEHINKVRGEVTVRDLAEKIAEKESTDASTQGDLRRSVYNSLHQHHLPKLDEANVIEYDKDRKTVDILDNARPVSLYMELRTPIGITWTEYYRSLAAMGLMLVVAHEIGTPLISEVPGLVIPVVFLAIVVISTGYQLWSHRWIYLRHLFG
jgi:hypothetical protein